LASTIRLSLTPLDNRILLEWEETVPWLNTEYEVYEVDAMTGSLDLLTVTDESFFEHQGLTNGTEYCYVIKSLGMFSEGSGIDQMIENFSQQSCSRPLDEEAPCAPSLSFAGTCEDETYQLIWEVSDEPCNEDITAYGIYYAPIDTVNFNLLTVIEGRDNLTYFPDQEMAVGCFKVTALDSLLILPDGTQSQNESEQSNAICLESCPVYELPNVISPNGDGFNDIFRPFDPYRYVESIDLNIYNRWGLIVFQTTNPAILWDGSNKDSGEQVSDGVYFFTVDIFERTLKGLVKRSLAGDLTIIDNRGTNTK
jgi:gliding motility-associated-like protein